MDILTKDIEESCVVAGYMVTEQERIEETPGFPRVPILLSASDCLAERPSGQDGWYASHQEALADSGTGRRSSDTRLLALLVPVGGVPQLVSDIRAGQVDDDFVLVENLTNRSPLAEGAALAGWEVLGYDNGLMHSWLCNDLYGDAVTELGVSVGNRGLLSNRADAEAVAAWANARKGTKPVTWFAAALAEWGNLAERRFPS